MRRLSIAAMASLLLFVAVGGIGVRSLHIVDSLNIDPSLAIASSCGCVVYSRRFVDYSDKDYPNFSSSAIGPYSAGDVLKFKHFEDSSLRLPLWPLLVLLLVAPVRWLISRPENAPAFPVISKQP